MKKVKLLPPTYLLISIIIMVFIHIFLPLIIIIPAPWRLTGVVILTLGISINVIADDSFRNAGTTVMPFKESKFLLTEGLYGISRNPMYLGFVLILFGVSVLLGSISPYFIIVIFINLIDQRFIIAEEDMLMKRFGTAYLEYKTRVRRWI